MGKGARLRHGGPGGTDTRRRRPSDRLEATLRGSGGGVGVGRPVGTVRRRMRASMAGPASAPAVDPWQGYGNAITMGKSKIARWKTGKTKTMIATMDHYTQTVIDSGQIKTLEDVVQVRERDEQERAVAHKKEPRRRGGMAAVRRFVTGKQMTGGPSDV